MLSRAKLYHEFISFIQFFAHKNHNKYLLLIHKFFISNKAHRAHRGCIILFQNSKKGINHQVLVLFDDFYQNKVKINV